MMWHRRTAHHGKKKADKAEMQISDTEMMEQVRIYLQIRLLQQEIQQQ
mgnify:CR=1 FL=1